MSSREQDRPSTLPTGAERESFMDARRDMVELQLARRGIDDSRVLKAMLDVPREEFVPEALRQQAHSDWPLQIGCGQTISQPFTVAYMAQAGRLEGWERVLEIGAGSGYGAAVLSRLAAEVHSVERIPQLADEAACRVKRLGYTNVNVHTADGTVGLPKYAPYNVIVVTASAKTLPKPLCNQLAEGGRIVMPIGDSNSQHMFRYTKRKEKLWAENLGSFAFVPLIGEFGWKENS